MAGPNFLPPNRWARHPSYIPPGGNQKPRVPVTGPPLVPGGPPPSIIESSLNVLPAEALAHYPHVTTAPFADVQLNVAGDFLAVPVPSGVRTIFAARCNSGSTGILLVAFNVFASPTNAIFELTAGSMIYLDVSVPQDSVFLGKTGGVVNGVLMYANLM